MVVILRGWGSSTFCFQYSWAIWVFYNIYYFCNKVIVETIPHKGVAQFWSHVLLTRGMLFLLMPAVFCVCPSSISTCISHLTTLYCVWRQGFLLINSRTVPGSLGIWCLASNPCGLLSLLHTPFPCSFSFHRASSPSCGFLHALLSTVFFMWTFFLSEGSHSLKTVFF